MCPADELDPLRHPSAPDELGGDALLHRLLHALPAACRAKLDGAVHRSQADVFILLSDTTQFIEKLLFERTFFSSYHIFPLSVRVFIYFVNAERLQHI